MYFHAGGRASLSNAVSRRKGHGGFQCNGKSIKSMSETLIPVSHMEEEHGFKLFIQRPVATKYCKKACLGFMIALQRLSYKFQLMEKDL